MEMTAVRLYTIGYEGRTPDNFGTVLDRNDVTKVVDIRQLPLSRKPGFSKTVLAAFLCEHRIEYVGMPRLGTPRVIRNQYKKDGNFDTLKHRYLEYIATVDDSVEKLYQVAIAEQCCLLCYERNPEQCHRSLLASAVARRNGRQFEVRHL